MVEIQEKMKRLQFDTRSTMVLGYKAILKEGKTRFSNVKKEYKKYQKAPQDYL
jgi:hypothetical protein